MRSRSLLLGRGTPRLALGLLIGLAASLLIAPTIANATASTPYDTITKDGAWKVTQGANWLAQSFSTGSSGLRVTDVAVRLRNANESNSSATSGTYSVSIWSSKSDAPDTQLGTVTSSQSLGAWGEDATLRTLGSPINLAANSRYFIVVNGSAGSTVGWKCNGDPVTTDVSPTPTFANFASSNSGSTWSALSGACAGQNFIMKITGTSRAVPTLSDFSNVSVTNGDPATTIVAPTASVAGSFTYSSSNTSVATITGNQLNFVGKGTSTITATFTPTDINNYTEATIAMTATVNNAAPVFPGGTTTTASGTSGTTTTNYTPAATDTDGDTITYSITAGTDANKFNINTTNGTLTFKTNATKGNYTLTITASDGTTTTNQNLTITVNNAAPVFPGGTTTTASGTSGTTTTNYTPAATDTDGDTITYSITAGTDANKFNINTTNGTLTFKTNATKGNYTLTITASDGTTTTNQNLTITVAALAAPQTTTTTTAPPTTTTTTTTTTIAPSTTTTSPLPTTTTAPAPTTTLPTSTTVMTATSAPDAPTDNIFGDDEATQAEMKIDAEIGSRIGSATATIRAVGLAPGAPVTLTVFSEPRILLTGTVDESGNFEATVGLPGDLEAGRHTLVLTSSTSQGDVNIVGTLNVDDKGLVSSIVQPAAIAEFTGPDDPRVERSAELGKPIYDPRSRPLTTASIVVAATGLIALAGAAGMGGSGMPSSSGGRMAARGASDDGQRRRNSRGKLAGAVTKKLKGLQIDGEARGDGGKTWRMPGTSRGDAISAILPNKFAKWSALAPRIVVDGSWLRAMFGSLGWLSWVAGLVLGVVGSFVDTRSPLTPTFGMILAIAALGILDAGGGAVAWITLVIVAAVGGDISGWPDVRTALGLGLVFASVPLLAHVIRPLRRSLRGNSFERWERVFDYVMMPVFVAFATGSMLKALNGLSGLELVTPEQVSAMRWLVAISIIVRLALEDVAAHHYPQRMAEVQPKKLVSPNRRVTSASIVVRSFIFLMVAEPFFGLNVRTVLAAALLAIPLVLKMWEDDLPNSPAINKWLPRGLFRFLCTLVLGAYMTSTLIGSDGGDSAVRSSFIWMLLPGVILGVVELFGRSGGDWPNVAVKRSLGAFVWLAAAGIVTGNIILFG